MEFTSQKRKLDLEDVKPKSTPRVVRMKRRGQQVVQGCDVYIGRKCTMGGWDLPQSKWANPFSVRECGSVEVAVAKYREFIENQPELLDSLDELTGKTLGCWCKPGPCHGDVLVDLWRKKQGKQGK